jgi:arylsulfatase A-like enzyme
MNVVVICTDSLRVDHLGCYGNPWIRTPNFDRLAAEGTVFLHAYSENLPTLPTRTAWWTGRYQFPWRGWQPFEHSDYLLAEILWDKGYTSALITDTYHMHKPVYNCGRGFDTVQWIRGQEYDPWIVDPSVRVEVGPWHRLKGDESDRLWRPRFEQYLRNRTAWGEDEEKTPTARVAKAAVAWLEEQVRKHGRRDRLFLWVDFFDPHEPWDPPEPYRSLYDPGYRGQEIIDPVAGPVEGYMTPAEIRHTMALYAGEVTMVDRWAGVVLDALRALGLWDHTLVMHVSDHGEPFGEHGIIRKARPWNYEELVHIPWILRHPDGLGVGRRIPALVQTVDLMPTILDALGIRGPWTLPYLAPTQTMFPQDIVVNRRQVELTGKSLMPLLRGEAEAVRDFAVSAHHGRQWSIRTADWSLLVPIDGSGGPELYDRRRDPGEHDNLIDREPERAAAMELQLRRFVDELERTR